MDFSKRSFFMCNILQEVLVVFLTVSNLLMLLIFNDNI